VTILALTTLFLLILVQVAFLFRVTDIVRNRLRSLIPERTGVIRELVAGMLFLGMVALVFGVYLFGPAYVMIQAFSLALSIPPTELGKFVPIFLFISLAVLGLCVKLWPKHLASCGLKVGTKPTRRKRRAGYPER
jgi:hypothetical protein